MSERSIRAVIRGRVQGVGFRWFVREAAQELGVSGRVRNRPDGSVEVEAGGPSEQVDQLVARLRAGPRGAEVADVAIEDRGDGPDDLSNPFEIVR